MKKLSRYRKNKASFWGVVVLLLLTLNLRAEEEGSAPDLESLINQAPTADAGAEIFENPDSSESSGASPAAGRASAAQSTPDTSSDSIADLEKAISDETKDSVSDEVPSFDKLLTDQKPEILPEGGNYGPKVSVTNLEFKMEQKGVSRIAVSFSGKPTYREVRNAQLKQVVYVFENAETPSKFQRAYDTTEFLSPVALFTMLQMPGDTIPLSKLIIQLREGKDPAVVASGRTLYIDFPAPEKKWEPKFVPAEPLAGEENIYASDKTFSGKPIEQLNVKNTDIQDVLRLIAKTSGYNIVVGDDVQGKIGTLSLENVPWDQAFTLVLQTKKLGYIKQGNVLRVGTLSTLKSEKEESIANEQSRIRVEQLKTVLVPISYAKAIDLAPRAKSVLSERGTVETDVRTNTVIVRDIEKVVVRVQKLLAALDTQPPRVAISAKIVEMASQFSRNIGFSSMAASQNVSGVNIDQNISLSTAGVSTTTIRAPNFANLVTAFRIGEQEDKVRILANPSVSVVANQQASVNQSVSFFVPVSEVAGGAVINTVKQITANLNLDVTPIVSGDGAIFMTVNVKNEVPRGTGASQSIDTRSVSTQVLVENGDTAVIGGIFSSTVKTTTEGIPFLMRIPIIGFFLSGESITDSRNEIFVFLTAKILNPEESFKRTL